MRSVLIDIMLILKKVQYVRIPPAGFMLKMNREPHIARVTTNCCQL